MYRNEKKKKTTFYLPVATYFIIIEYYNITLFINN